MRYFCAVISMLYIHIIVCFCCAAKYVSVAHKYLA